MALKNNLKNYSIILLLIIINQIIIINGLQQDVSPIDALRAQYLQLEDETWDAIETENNQKLILKNLFNNYEEFFIKNIPDNYMENEFYFLNVIYEWKILENELIVLDTLFRAYRIFLNHSVTDQLAAIDFTDTVLSDPNWPINKTLNQIDNIMIKQGMYYKAMLEAQQQVCETRQSAQQVLYQLYKSISITELKGYAMMQFSCMLLKIYGKGNFTRESQIMREMFEKRTQKTQDLLQNVMQRAERSVWRCDPRVHVQGETYEEVTRLLQGYIENEVDMNNDGTCKENCGHYEYTENFGCYAEMYCNRQPKCKGKLLNCKFIDSDMWICPARQTNSNKRRYEYIEYENGRILGKQKNCVTGTTKVESWWRWLFWHCSYCLCVCDEQGPLSDRYFNLREVTTNVTENKVVTGLRFRKINRIIHLQVQEGTLMERGLINDTTLKWKEMSEYRLLDRGIKNGLDYHTLGWDRRSIDLDDLIAPQKHVCTGVRFRVVGTHLNLEMRVTEIDFTNGKLIEPEKSYWISNDNTDISKIKRTPVKLINPDIPTYAHSSSLPDSKTNQYVEFTHTDVDSDVAQTTVPYLDAQDCVSIPPVALAGVGIYHKGLPMSGGFVAPKLITYDFSSYIDTPKPPTQNTDENFIETF